MGSARSRRFQSLLLRCVFFFHGIQPRQTPLLDRGGASRVRERRSDQNTDGSVEAVAGRSIGADKPTLVDGWAARQQRGRKSVQFADRATTKACPHAPHAKTRWLSSASPGMTRAWSICDWHFGQGVRTTSSAPVFRIGDCIEFMRSPRLSGNTMIIAIKGCIMRHHGIAAFSTRLH
jgi:hypothetical protein